MTVSPRGWLVQAASLVVRQPFYAALDAEDRACWTDDPARAARFPLRKDAERFASLNLHDADWMVTR